MHRVVAAAPAQEGGKCWLSDPVLTPVLTPVVNCGTARVPMGLPM